ncbi:MAG: 1-acyl-sn-glycerol-3-phosphate acyltransferase [Armatimonadia bacterium]|nr:1-acyl-sn-glycerol-3-phosphate acyltransferase [Armatimonadia bacterium]
MVAVPKPGDIPAVGRWTWWRHLLYWMGGTLGRLICKMGGLTLTGMENIPEEGGFVLASNHMSYLDPPAIGGSIQHRRRLCYMAHAGLFEIPVFGRLIGAVGAFPVKRGTADRKAIRTAVALLRGGQPVLVFPEGTRSPVDDAHLPSELGAAYLAALSEAPIIPVGIRGTSNVLPRGAKFFRARPVEIHFGPPVDLPMLEQGKRDKEALEGAAYAIMDAITDLTGLPHPGVMGTETAVWPEGTGDDWKPKNLNEEDA